jgi:hypothetical protein
MKLMGMRMGGDEGGIGLIVVAIDRNVVVIEVMIAVVIEVVIGIRVVGRRGGFREVCWLLLVDGLVR